jgi:hypothetical protein
MDAIRQLLEKGLNRFLGSAGFQPCFFLLLITVQNRIPTAVPNPNKTGGMSRLLLKTVIWAELKS